MAFRRSCSALALSAALTVAIHGSTASAQQQAGQPAAVPPAPAPQPAVTHSAAPSAPASPAKREKPPLPSGPLPAKLGDHAAWQIQYSYEADRATKGGAAAQADPNAAPEPLSLSPIPGHPLRSVVVKRTKPYWTVVTTDIRGQSYKQWSDGTDDFVEAPAGGAALAASSERILLPNFSRSDFPGLEWLSPSHYVGVETVGETPCFVFVRDNMTVWIRQDNRLPVRSVTTGTGYPGTETRTYTVLPRPSSQIVFPEAVERISAAIRKDRKYATQPVPRGG